MQCKAYIDEVCVTVECKKRIKCQYTYRAQKETNEGASFLDYIHRVLKINKLLS